MPHARTARSASALPTRSCYPLCAEDTGIESINPHKSTPRCGGKKKKEKKKRKVKIAMLLENVQASSRPRWLSDRCGSEGKVRCPCSNLPERTLGFIDCRGPHLATETASVRASRYSGTSRVARQEPRATTLGLGVGAIVNGKTGKRGYGRCWDSSCRRTCITRSDRNSCGLRSHRDSYLSCTATGSTSTIATIAAASSCAASSGWQSSIVRCSSVGHNRNQEGAGIGRRNGCRRP